MEYALIFGYWLVGFVVVALISRRMNHGLSVIDILACTVAAIGWPLFLAMAFVWVVCCKAPWLYEARFFKLAPRSRKHP